MREYDKKLFQIEFQNFDLETTVIDFKHLSEADNIFIENLDNMRFAMELISCLDLTTLEGSDNFDSVAKLCNRAIEHKTAAVCIYPRFIKFVKEKLSGTGIKTASVATAFPSGQVPLSLKLNEVKYCIGEGADEIDMVISRGEFLAGNYNLVYDEIAEVKSLCKPANVHLKVILETGELKTNDNIYSASLLAMDAGADFIKTSTGKISVSATPETAFVMLSAIKKYYEETNIKIGFKPAGGIKQTSHAFLYFALVKNILGEQWMNKELFRIGASSLLDELIKI